MKVRTLQDLAVAINAMDNGFTATTEKSYTSTDIHPHGVRWRIAGKGRKGTKLTLRTPTGEVVNSWDTSHTTPVCVAITTVKRLFGAKIDLDPQEVFEVGSQVRVVSNFNLEASVISVFLTKTGKARLYDIKFRNGVVRAAEPWELQLGNKVK